MSSGSTIEPTKASGLSRCPADIVYLILKELSSAEYRTLCLVAQKFRLLVQPLLYSKIQWLWEEECHGPPQLPCLIRTLFSRPDLAANLRIVHLAGKKRTLSRRWKVPRFPMPEAELYGPTAFIRRARVPYGDDWIQGLRDGDLDALLALLLSQLHNLQRLYLGYDFTRRPVLIGKLLLSAVSDARHDLPDFRHLHEVSFLRRVDRDEAFDASLKNTAHVLPFFYLPAIERMAIMTQNPEEWTWPTAHAPVPSNLTSLHLLGIREGCLGEILAVLPNLNALHWEWYYDHGVRDKFTTQTLDLDRIAADLSRVRGPLTNLKITAGIECAIAIGDQFNPGLKASGSLRGMHTMDTVKTLYIPWEFLVGFAQDTARRVQDVLPRNVEIVTLTDDLALQNDDNMEPQWPMWEWEDWAMLAVLRSWIDEWEICTPHLRGVTLQLTWIDTDMNQWLPDKVDEFTKMGGRAGLTFKFVALDGEIGPLL
ncbi:hypothetical protein BJY00DRAFT_64591 [Aspergillus carlsbadensis]|nr:hypothetical protein BJY00DRAFT_64591 [Aspergillus carlsbadensis]